MIWAQRLRRVLNIDIEVCDICGKKVKEIACIEARVVIRQILTHLNPKSQATQATRRPESRAPSQAGLFD